MPIKKKPAPKPAPKNLQPVVPEGAIEYAPYVFSPAGRRVLDKIVKAKNRGPVYAHEQLVLARLALEAIAKCPSVEAVDIAKAALEVVR